MFLVITEPSYSYRYDKPRLIGWHITLFYNGRIVAIFDVMHIFSEIVGLVRAERFASNYATTLTRYTWNTIPESLLALRNTI